MAVYFINDGMHITGSMRGIIDSNRYNVQVGILHDPNDGYKLSFDGERIKEQLALNEFIIRLIEGETLGQNKPMDGALLHRNIRTVIDALNDGRREKVEDVARWLDHRYSNLIRNGKIMLMEHTHSIRAMRVNSQPMTTEEAYEKIPSKEKGVTDDEVYYAMI